MVWRNSKWCTALYTAAVGGAQFDTSLLHAICHFGQPYQSHSRTASAHELGCSTPLPHTIPCCWTQIWSCPCPWQMWLLSVRWQPPQCRHCSTPWGWGAPCRWHLRSARSHWTCAAWPHAQRAECRGRCPVDVEKGGSRQAIVRYLQHGASTVLAMWCSKSAQTGSLHGKSQACVAAFSSSVACYHTSNSKWSKTWSMFSVSFNFFMSFASSLSGSNLNTHT